MLIPTYYKRAICTLKEEVNWCEHHNTFSLQHNVYLIYNSCPILNKRFQSRPLTKHTNFNILGFTVLENFFICIHTYLFLPTHPYIQTNQFIINIISFIVIIVFFESLGYDSSNIGILIPQFHKNRPNATLSIFVYSYTIGKFHRK